MQLFVCMIVLFLFIVFKSSLKQKIDAVAFDAVKHNFFH